MRRNRHYQERVNRVLDYIGEHLDGDLSLETLAGVGCFSAFHFHRVFQGVTGETLHAHVKRVRLERAAALLKASPKKTITAVALEVGFAGTAEFSRAFQGQFGMAASRWDRKAPLENSKICKVPDGMPFHTVEELETWQVEAAVDVRVRRLPGFRFVYHRIYAPYGNTKLLECYQELLAWLKESGIGTGRVVFSGMSLDDPSITPAEKCRYDLGVAFPGAQGMLGELVKARGEKVVAGLPELPEGFTLREFAAQDVVSLHCVGDIGAVGKAWQYLYRVWLPTSRYEPAEEPAMEFFVKLPEEIGWERFDLELCIPVVRL